LKALHNHSANTCLCCVSVSPRDWRLYGFSSLVWSHAVGPEGAVTGLEFSGEFAAAARAAFEKHGAANTRIVEGNALATLPTLDEEPFDIIFIDAQKPGYPAYLASICRCFLPVISLPTYLSSQHCSSLLAHPPETRSRHQRGLDPKSPTPYLPNPPTYRNQVTKQCPRASQWRRRLRGRPRSGCFARGADHR
jgi:hypothetical protein